jgi:endoglucanase
MIPNRDCGGASAGGAPDLASYDAWVQKFAAGLGDEQVLVILEPDSLALITCLSSSELSARNASLSRAGAAIHAANPNAKVYYDAGHSAWNSASVMASRLKAAGITNGDGIYSNVSNYQRTSNEVSFTKQVLSSIGGSNLHAVIDTSRNGNGPAAGGEWCDPSGRSIGSYPTTNTGDPAIDAYLWIKPPGEVDGCAGQAGQFQPAIAYDLARNAPNPPTSGPSPTGTPTSTPTASPTSSAPAGSCSVAYTVNNSWNGGFTAEVIVTNTGSAALGWSLAWDFPNDQRITSSWNGTAVQSGRSVTATGVDWNKTLAPGASATLGFQASVGSANGEPASFAINGSACTTV